MHVAWLEFAHKTSGGWVSGVACVGEANLLSCEGDATGRARGHKLWSMTELMVVAE